MIQPTRISNSVLLYECWEEQIHHKASCSDMLGAGRRARRNAGPKVSIKLLLMAAPMSPLAKAVYEILRRQIFKEEPRLTYKELAERLRDTSDDFAHVNHRSQQLYAALWELGRECRGLRLPCLAALVVRADTRRPGDAYFEGPESRNLYKDEKVAAWKRELEAVRKAKYPRLRRRPAARPGRGRSTKTGSKSRAL